MRTFTTLKREQSEDEESALVKKIQRWISEGADNCVSIHDRCEENNSYVAGDAQWAEGDIERQKAKDRPHMPMNKVLPALNSIANREIMQRYVPKAYGRSRSDGGWAEVFDEFMRWQRDMSETEHEESMTFRSCVSSGYACAHKYWDPLEDDGRGLILDEEVPVWWMLWDSRARKQNLVDRRWHICGKFVALAEAEEEYGDVTPRSRSMFDSFGRESVLDLAGTRAGGRWPWLSIATGKWYSTAEEEVFLMEVEWKDISIEFKAAIPVRINELVALISDPEASIQLTLPAPQGVQPPVITVTGEQYAGMGASRQRKIRDLLLAETKLEIFKDRGDLREFEDTYLELTGDAFTDWAKYKKYAHKYAVMCGETILEYGDRPMGFTYEFMTGIPKATREGTTFFGFVDVAKGPQDWRNTFMSLALTRLATSPKQTMIIEESAVEDVDEFFDQLSNPRGAAIVPDGFIAGQKHLLLQPPTFPPFERELMSIAEQGVGEQAGLSGIDTGAQQDLRRISGTVVQSVREASNTILALFFDALRRYRRRNGHLTMRFMYEFYSPEQVARIVGEEKAGFVPDKASWPDIERFDIKIDEAPTSPTERMEFFDFLTRTGTLEKWVDQDRIPFDMVLDWLPYVSEPDRMKIKEYQQKKEQFGQLTAFLQQSQEGQQLLAQYQQSQQGGGGQPQQQTQ
jgi:hypothetical protein